MAIYLKHGDTYLPMTEQPYDAESVLQELIERHPEMLAGEDTAHRPLLLVRREAGVNDREEGGARWSLDHLYIDAKAVPTLVEVKRRSDTRGRREVVAQMLDYAANAKTSFKAEKMAEWLKEECRRRETTTAAALLSAFGVDDVDAYWDEVAKNMEAQRFRLIFVSDVIGPELRKIIEFLNGQMARTEVLAIEVKQYVAGEHQTIVPRVIGDTQDAKDIKQPVRRTRFNRERVLAVLAEVSDEATDAAGALLDWATSHSMLEVTYGDKPAADIRFGGRIVLRIFAKGELQVSFKTLKELDPAWDDDRIEDLVQRIEAIEDVRFLSPKRNWPPIDLKPLADPPRRQQLINLLDDVFRDLGRNQHGLA